MITTIFIDIDNTLLDFDKCAYLSMKSAFEDCGLPFENSMFDTFERINLSLWHRLEEKIITKEQLFKIRWSTGLGLIYDGIEMEKRFKHYLYTYAVTIEGAEELLKHLSSKYKVYATSNATYDQQISRLKNAGFDKYFDGYFISERAGAEKPSKEFFDYCFKNIPDFKKEETIIVGDSISADIIGGKNVGITTVWFNIKGETSSLPDYEIHALPELKDLLERM